MESKGGSIKSTSINGVKLYSISGQRNPAAWLAPKKLKALRKEKDYQRRVDIIQDLRFETATSKVKVTPDGEYVIASGIYPPQVKVYELQQLSLKFERHLVSEIINFQVLADDYSKIAFLCADRSVCLHAKYGSHYSLRIPRMGRDMAYDCWSCDLLCAASSPDLYRINLDQGRFLSSLKTQSPAINVVSRSTIHGLVASGGDDGAVECFDIRKKSSVGRIDAAMPAGGVDQEVTAVQFDENHGYFMAVGTSAGKGDNMTSIEPTGGAINDMCIFRDSGLMLLALDCSQIPAYFIPALGPAPKWCSHLDNLTEEMEEGTQSIIYDDYKFLTKEDLERLSLTSLIGTNLLRAYMHGFFIDYRLYKKAQAAADPFAYEAYIERVKQDKIEAERASRITIKRKLPKVNRLLAARILENEEADEEVRNVDDAQTKKKLSKKNKGLTSDILKDDRFKAMFENKDFEIDEQSTEYQSLHPQSSKKQPSLLEEHFEPVMEDEEQGIDDSDASATQSSEEEPDSSAKKHKASKHPRLYEVKDERHAEAFWNSISLAEEDVLPLGERIALQEQQQASGRRASDVKLGPGGAREISFVSRSLKRHRGEEPREEKRRGVQSLGLKPTKSEFYSSRGGRGGRGRGGHGGRGRGRR